MVLIIKHEEIEGPGTLGYFFNSTHWEVETVELGNGGRLPSLDRCEAIISMGGPMNVYEEDRFPFLGLETEFLKGAIDKTIPILGICLGAQLLAKSMDAEVRKAECEEIGWYNLKLTKEARSDPLFKGLSSGLEAFQWHEDTFDIPPRGHLLATSSNCKNQAMRIGVAAWGLQFHPEVTLQMIEDWIDYYQPGNFNRSNLIDGYLEKRDRYYAQGQRLYQNFAGIIANGH